MSFRYDGNKLIPQNVLSALRYTGKVGFMSRQVWHEFFGQGNDRWQRRQMKFLLDQGYLKDHRNPFAKQILILGSKGVAILNAMHAPCVKPVPVMYLAHDSVVARSMLQLVKGNLIGGYLVERELKTYGVKDFMLSNKDHDQKYPDAVFKMSAFKKPRTVALEYERERKSLSRYKNILWQYSELTNISVVLFICENLGTQKIIESAMKYLGQTSLMDRLSFASAEEWQKSALDAPIQMKSGTVTFRKICDPVSINS